MGRSSKKLEKRARVSRNGNGKLGWMEKGLDGHLVVRGLGTVVDKRVGLG